mmetsp:Transcript_21353/g.48146  ORF Transcript_21353/g.48146 Transcript_21353/m.48146 type:complete len:93 (-) Transcript_21353:672-950(-)
MFFLSVREATKECDNYLFIVCNKTAFFLFLIRYFLTACLPATSLPSYHEDVYTILPIRWNDVGVFFVLQGRERERRLDGLLAWRQICGFFVS